ncbi:sensor histidine kinase [Desulfoferrobacter suflitae]|uniref:sensor histidine kinase n=1 Tax=Desulfoferrobacter suflitae TaxID=2865782 RepID=UPI00216428AD|nr:HAMP domain-containing histidine kinase [Desulfoferrobacter suflitae]MCK8604017.1 HAMP domain-containing histidine kinase [Desulfoferrobacter suflitae]
MLFKTIRNRLTAWYVGLLTVAFVILGGAAYQLLSYSLNQEMDNTLTSVARVLAERAAREPGASFAGEVDEIFRRFFGFSPVHRYFRMLSPLGNRASTQFNQASETLPLSNNALNNAARGLPTFESVQGPYHYPVRLLTMPVMQGKRLTNIIQVGMPLENLQKTLIRYLLVMAVLLPAVLLVAAAGGWFLVRRALQPVDRMTKAASRISAEHLTERVEETHAGDELDRLAKTFNQMLARLDAAFSQVRQFSASASHELQTPLTILRGELEVALRSSRSPDEYQQIIRSSLEEIDKLSQLVDGMLMLSRAEAGVLKFDRRQIDLAALVEEVYWRLRVLAESKSVDLLLDRPDCVSVQGDRERLRQLLVNVIENGVKYTGDGGRVAVSLRQANDCAVVEVSDTGGGIPEEEHEQVFQPFYRTLDALPEKGAGLGLSIARSIALAHQGRIEIDSAPGKGSTLRIVLPTGQNHLK